MNTHDATGHDGAVGDLVIGAAERDTWAWQQLVARFSGLIASITASHRLDEADSARVAASVWRRLDDDLDRIRRPDRIATWLGAVTRDECVKVLTNAPRRAA